MIKRKPMYACFASFCSLASVFGIFVSLHAPTFALTPAADLIGEIGRHASEEESSVDVKNLGRNLSQQGLTFVFIIDCSDSPSSLLKSTPRWLLSSLQSLKRGSFPVSQTLANAEKASSQTVMKAAAFVMLEKAVKAFEVEGESRHFFAIWSVCADASKEYPRNGLRARLLRSEVDAAIQIVDKIEWTKQDRRDTDLVSLFDRIVSSYLSEEDPFLGKNTPPTFVVSMISDFVDSPRSQHVGNIEEIRQRRKRELREVLDVTVRGRTQLNMITIGDEQFDAEVLSFLESNTEWYRYSRFDIYEDLPGVARRMLYPLYEVEPLKLLYEPGALGDSRASIQFDAATAVELELPFPLEPQEGAFIYGTRPPWRRGEGQLYGADGRLMPKQGPRLIEMKANDLLDLSYSGDVPAKRQVLRVLVDADRKTYLMRLHFVPRIPWFSALVMQLLVAAGVLLGLLSLSMFFVALGEFASRLRVDFRPDEGYLGVRVAKPKPARSLA